MRRRVLLLVAATTSLVLVAFLVPLALLVRTVAVERAVLAATADAQALTALVAVAEPAALALAVAQVDATSPARVSVFPAGGGVLGAPASRTPLVELAARGNSASGTVDVHLSWLRRKLGETAQAPRFLVSVRGVGVKLVEPDA